MASGLRRIAWIILGAARCSVIAWAAYHTVRARRREESVLGAHEAERAAREAVVLGHAATHLLWPTRALRKKRHAELPTLCPSGCSAGRPLAVFCCLGLALHDISRRPQKPTSPAGPLGRGCCGRQKGGASMMECGAEGQLLQRGQTSHRQRCYSACATSSSACQFWAA